MEFTGSPDMVDAVEKLKKRFRDVEHALLVYLDDATNSGLSDKRWMAIARTHFEQGFLAVQEKGLVVPSAARREYAKQPAGSETYPVAPPADYAVDRTVAAPPTPAAAPPVIEDYRADEGLTRP